MKKNEVEAYDANKEDYTKIRIRENGTGKGIWEYYIEDNGTWFCLRSEREFVEVFFHAIINVITNPLKQWGIHEKGKTDIIYYPTRCRYLYRESSFNKTRSKLGKSYYFDWNYRFRGYNNVEFLIKYSPIPQNVYVQEVQKENRIWSNTDYFGYLYSYGYENSGFRWEKKESYTYLLFPGNSVSEQKFSYSINLNLFYSDEELMNIESYEVITRNDEKIDLPSMKGSIEVSEIQSLLKSKGINDNR